MLSSQIGRISKQVYSVGFNKLKYSRKLLSFIGLILIIYSCKEKNNESDKILIWENFKTNIENNEYEYLIENSTDSIKCIDCIIGKKEYKIPSRIIFKNYKEKLYNSDLLDKKEYSVYSDDKMIRISYGFKNLTRNESSDIVYMFDKINDKFLFTGMITIP